MSLAPGTRVRLRREVAAQFEHYALGRLGTIVGTTQSAELVKVRWDGVKRTQRWHVDFLVRVRAT